MKKISIAILAIISILAIIVACKKTPEVNLKYVDVERDLVTVGITTANIQCDYDYIATLKKAFLHYGESEEETDMVSAEMRVVQNTLYVDLTGLKENTTYSYYYEFFNGFNSMRSASKTFKTENSSGGGGGGNGNAPEGAIDGLFSVSPTQKVYFSQGNLQYQASTNTWRFAENQWDYVGDGVYGTVVENGVKCNNELISSTYDGWIDLFGWGTSGYNHGAMCYQPWSTTSNYLDYCAYGFTTYPNMYNLNDQTGQADWGVNAISNGGNSPGLWRTLTYDELIYLFHSRIQDFNLDYTFVKAQVDEINGIILFPDDWDCSYYSFNNVNPDTDFDSNIINAFQWDTLKQYGVVFLPAAGRRFGGTVSEVLSWGFSWSASYVKSEIDYTHAHSLYFTNGSYSTGFENPRYTGCSVRLVQDAH